MTVAEPEPDGLRRFREEHAALNRTTPVRVDPETINELSRSHQEPAEQVNALVRAAEARDAAAAMRQPRPRPTRRPLAWSAVVVLIVLLLCALAAWLGWLWVSAGR